MLHGPFQENPAAATLLTLGRQQVSGTVEYADRELVLSRGDCVALGPTVDEPSIQTFLNQSLRVPPSRLQAAIEAAEALAPQQADASEGSRAGAVSAAEQERRLVRTLLEDPDVDSAKLRGLLRALYTERLAQSFRQASGLPELLLSDIHRAPVELVRFQMLSLVLDSLSQAAAHGDTQLISRDLSARLRWLEGPQVEAAQHWAAIGPLTDGPALSSVLVRRPAAAPTIAAIVRAGLASLQSSVEGSAHIKTLPPPAPQLEGNVRPPHRLRPHRADTAGDGRPDPVTRVLSHIIPFDRQPAPSLPPADPEFTDPLRGLEADIMRKEESGAAGAVLAELWLSLALLWEERLFSPTEAARALREAVAVHPYNSALLQRTALACNRAGDRDLALEYAQAAVMAASDATEYVEAQRSRATLLLRQLDHHEAIKALQNAAAEQGAPAEVVVQLAQLMAASDHPDAATALVRAAQSLGTQPIIAAGLWAEATLRTPHVGITVQGLAKSLSEGGYSRAAVAALWDTAELGLSGNARLPLLNQAVRLAQRSRQNMLATILLVRALELSPMDTAIEMALSTSLGLSGLSRCEQIAIAQDIARLSGTERRAACLAFAGTLAMQEPSERTIGRMLLRAAVDAGDHSAQTRALLGTDEAEDALSAEGRCQQLQEELKNENDRARIIAGYAELSGIQHMRGDLRATVSAAMRCLSLEPQHPMASARLLRAASLLAEPTILDEAFSYAIQNAVTHTRRALLHTARGQLAFARGANNEALAHALSALQSDPHHGAALFLLLRCQDDASADTLHAALTAGERALPDLPTVLYLRIQVAEETGNRELQAELLERWARTAPLDPRPRYQKLQLSLQQTAVDPIVADARALLPLACSEAHLQLICDACQRIAARGELRDAALTLLDTMDHAGSRDRAQAELALEYARLSTDPELVTRALERHYIAYEGTERIRSLWHLTAHYRHHLDQLGELRTQLRVLAEAGLYTDVVERLLELFSRVGDHDRLQAVIQLALDNEHDSSRRERLWFLLATAHQTLGNDLSKAQEAINAWLHEEPKTEQRLQTAVGLLLGLSSEPQAAIAASATLAADLDPDTAERFALRLICTAHRQEDTAAAVALCREFIPRYPESDALLALAEELTLATRDRATAFYLYRALESQAPGQHTVQALNYRAAQWLERAGAAEEALAELVAVINRAPASGAALDAVERLCHELDRPRVLFDVYLALATSGDPQLRRRFFPRAAHLAEELALPSIAALAEEAPPEA